MRALLTIFLTLNILTGAVYPYVVRLAAHLMFPAESEGSLILRNGTIIGSELVGQEFTSSRYFWGRPSATTPGPYNAAASSGSNLAATNPALVSAVSKRVEILQRSLGIKAEQRVPVDLVTTSASGLDPHISIAAARLQSRRVAASRGIDTNQLEKLIETHRENRLFGIFGEPRVNVLKLNLALDEFGR